MSQNPPNWQALIEEYEQGASDVEIAKLLKITIVRFYDLIQESPAFAEFVERGRTVARAWWESAGRKNLWNKEFNTSLWNFNMKNRYGWADKMDTNDMTDKAPVDRDQAVSQLQQAIKQLAKKNPEVISGMNLNAVKE